MPPRSLPVPVRLLLIAVALLAAVLTLPLGAHATEGEVGPSVDILQFHGPVDPPVVAAISDLVSDASDRGSRLVLLQVDSPGGLAVEREEVVAAVRDGDVPVVVWIGPGAAQARGAALFLAAAGDLTAATRDATLGPACPIRAGGDGCEAEDAVRLADLFAGEAAGAGPGAVDAGQLPVEDVWDAARAAEAGLVSLTVDDYASLLQDLDGRQLADGSTLELPEEDLTVRLHSLGLLRRVLHASLDPVLIAVLLVAMLLLIAFEVFQPGFGVAGVAAILIAPLLVYGLVVMPVTWWAVALLVVGAGLLGIDLAIAGLGVPTAAGAAATAAGLWWLFPGGSPILHVPGWVTITLTIITVVYFVVIMTVVLRAQAGPELDTSAEELVGQVGVVRSTMNPEGHVFVSGGLWRARWDGPESGRVRTGTTVQVTGVDGATLVVGPDERSDTD